MSAGGVLAARPANQQARGGSTPTPALHDVQVRPIPLSVAKGLIVRHHYLHTVPGGTHLAFGAFCDRRLLGAVTLGVGPFNAHRLVQGATNREVLTLTRLWLSDTLPTNSESRVIGVVLRYLRRHTGIQFVLSYADPAQGHVGTIYQATGWLYTGLSDAMPLYKIGNGPAKHSRSFSHAFGTHSVRHFREHGINVGVVPQGHKHRYLYPVDPTVTDRLNVPVLPYPKREVAHADG